MHFEERSFFGIKEKPIISHPSQWYLYVMQRWLIELFHNFFSNVQNDEELPVAKLLQDTAACFRASRVITNPQRIFGSCTDYWNKNQHTEYPFWFMNGKACETWWCMEMWKQEVISGESFWETRHIFESLRTCTYWILISL